jgi:molybdate transport system substrate-binding protein
MKILITLSFLLIGVTLLSSFTPRGKKEILIAAAADLRFAMDSLVATFKIENPDIDIKVSYGSSGIFFEQISNGAPFDLFFSADLDYAKKLKEKSIAITEVKTYGTGQLVLWSKIIDPNILKMNSLLNNAVAKIAIANPDHAPYGKRAVESLNYYHLYDQVKTKLVLGENISQTAQFLTSGAAEIGLVALSLALSPNMQREGGKFWLIPAETHKVLEQGYVMLQHARDNAEAVKFMTFIGSPKAESVFREFGFK